MRKNILVGQSGGPTAVINASLYGVITEGSSHPEQIGAVYGMVNGIEGFLSGQHEPVKKPEPGGPAPAKADPCRLLRLLPV